MKRIILILPYGGIGGMEKLAENLYQYYKTKGHLVKVIKVIQLPTDVIHFGEDEIGFSTVDFAQMSALKRLFFYLSLPFRIRKVIKQHDATHSIGFSDFISIFSAFTYTNEFKIGSIHSLKSVELKQLTPINRLVKIGYRSFYKRFDRLICISEALKTDLITACNYHYPSHCKVIYNPHHVERYQQLATAALPDAYQTVFSKPTAVFVGRISFPKALWHLVASFSLVKKEVPDAQLVIVGDGSVAILKALKKLVTTYGLEDAVHFAGMQSNPYPYIQHADVVALSSYFEGTPNIIVEAIALGKPVVTTRSTESLGEMMFESPRKLPDTQETILTRAGYIVPTFYTGEFATQSEVELTKNHQLFADAVAKCMLSDKAKLEVQEAQSALLAKYDLAEIAEAYLA